MFYSWRSCTFILYKVGIGVRLSGESWLIFFHILGYALTNLFGVNGSLMLFFQVDDHGLEQSS